MDIIIYPLQTGSFTSICIYQSAMEVSELCIYPYGYMQYMRTILYRLCSAIYLLSYSSSTSDILRSSASQHDENIYTVRVGFFWENHELTLTLSTPSFLIAVVPLPPYIHHRIQHGPSLIGYLLPE